MPKLDPYDKKLSYSYALGIFPALKLLENRPDCVTRLLLSPDGLNSDGVQKLRDRCAELGIREEMAERVLRRESKKNNCFAALVFDKYNSKLESAANHVVLHRISDSGNLGTILRTLLGFGIKNVAIIRPAVDAFDPHVLRSTMGAFYSMNVCYYNHIDEYRNEYPEHFFYPFMLDGAIFLNQAAKSPKEPYSLVFGNEATGLPAEFAQMGQSVMIPQSKDIDSLNLSVAASIAAYAFVHGNKE